MIRNQFMYAFCLMNLKPGISMLQNPEANSDQILEVVMRNLFRQMENWKYDFSCLPQSGVAGHDPGIPKEEAVEVYGILDQVFKEVFPAQRHLTRPEAAEYAQNLITKVREEILGEGAGIPGAKQHLTLFMEHVLSAFEHHRSLPLDCVEA